jgi:hypothetical protein
MKRDIGGGWSYNPINDQYEFRQNNFTVSGDVVISEMRDWGRKIENVHILAVLRKIYKLANP